MVDKLVNEIVEGADTLQTGENRALVRANAAGLLWNREADRARALVRLALADLGALTFDERTSLAQRQTEIQVALGLRHQILQLVAQHDARFALELLKSSRRDLPWVAEATRHEYDDDLHLEMSLAQQVAHKDPQLAVELVEARLTKGAAHEATSLLWQLRDSHPEQATRLANSVLQQIRSTTTADRGSFHAAMSLLHVAAPETEMSSAVPTGGKPDTVPAKAKRTTLLDDRALRELAEYVAAGATNGSIMPYEMSQIAETLTPVLQRHAPERLAAIRRQAAQAQQQLDPTARLHNEFNSKAQNSTIDELLALAAKAPVGMRDNFYHQIVWKAINDNDVARARRIIDEQISNPSQRQSMLMQIEQRAVQQAIDENRLPDARARINSITASEERLQAMLNLAFTLKNKNETEAARSVLADAHTQINAELRGGARLQAQLQLATACAGVDAERGFGIATEVATLLNPVLDHAAALDEYVLHQRSFKAGELLLSQHNFIGSEAFHSWMQALQALGASDLPQSIAAADQATRPEVRMMARLTILQGALADDMQSNSTAASPSVGSVGPVIVTRRY